MLDHACVKLTSSIVRASEQKSDRCGFESYIYKGSVKSYIYAGSVPPKQISFLSVSSENKKHFLKSQGTRLDVVVASNKGI